MYWGLLGPEFLASQRRTRTLGLGAAVRHLNDLAVPGMGNAWFAKQLFLALLGIHLAEKAKNNGQKVSNIETANALEALACCAAFKQNGWNADRRLRGRQKLRGKDDLSFARVRKRGFYVVQPMRIATIQPLISLGLVEGSSERFNAVRCSDLGLQFLNAACQEYRPQNRSVPNHLLLWIERKEFKSDNGTLNRALSPLEPLSKEALDILRECLVSQGACADRRKSALAWASVTKRGSDWTTKPDVIAEDHWQDMRSGARFFVAREAAVAALESVENYVGSLTDRAFALETEVPDGIQKKLDDLQVSAKIFLDEHHDPSPSGIAGTFCSECTQSSVNALTFLIQRDEQVLRLRDGKIVPGPAFRGGGGKISVDEDDDEELAIRAITHWPEGISPRIQNLYLMGLDLDGKLNEELASGSNE